MLQMWDEEVAVVDAAQDEDAVSSVSLIATEPGAVKNLCSLCTYYAPTWPPCSFFYTSFSFLLINHAWLHRKFELIKQH